MQRKGADLEIYEEIKETIGQNREQFLTIFSYSSNQLMKSLLRYGKSSAITKSSLTILKQFLKNYQEEQTYLHLLLQNRKVGYDYNAVFAFLDQLDMLNEDWVLYLYEALDDILVAYEMNRESKSKLPLRNFALLTETDIYRQELTRILLGREVLKEYYPYPQEFWEYIAKKITILDLDLEESMSFIGVYPKLNSSNQVIDIKVYLPPVTSLSTLLIVIHEYNHAYQMYWQLGQEFLDLPYEEMAKQEEEKFLQTYFEPAYQRYFKRK